MERKVNFSCNTLLNRLATDYQHFDAQNGKSPFSTSFICATV